MCVYVPSTTENARKLSATRRSRGKEMCFSPAQGETRQGLRTEQSSTTATGPAEQYGRVTGSAGANHSGEGNGGPYCPFSGLDLHNQFPRDHFFFLVMGPAFFLSLCSPCLLKQRPTAEWGAQILQCRGETESNWLQS